MTSYCFGLKQSKFLKTVENIFSLLCQFSNYHNGSILSVLTVTDYVLCYKSLEYSKFCIFKFTSSFLERRGGGGACFKVFIHKTHQIFAHTTWNFDIHIDKLWAFNFKRCTTCSCHDAEAIFKTHNSFSFRYSSKEWIRPTRASWSSMNNFCWPLTLRKFNRKMVCIIM